MERHKWKTLAPERFNKDNLPFDPNKDYRLIGGMIQENLGTDMVAVYDVIGLGIDLVNIGTSSNTIIRGAKLNDIVIKSLDILQTSKSVVGQLNSK